MLELLQLTFLDVGVDLVVELLSRGLPLVHFILNCLFTLALQETLYVHKLNLL